jgi:hypothetical protein
MVIACALTTEYAGSVLVRVESFYVGKHNAMEVSVTWLTSIESLKINVNKVLNPKRIFTKLAKTAM